MLYRLDLHIIVSMQGYGKCSEMVQNVCWKALFCAPTLYKMTCFTVRIGPLGLITVGKSKRDVQLNNFISIQVSKELNQKKLAHLLDGPHDGEDPDVLKPGC